MKKVYLGVVAVAAISAGTAGVCAWAAEGGDLPKLVTTIQVPSQKPFVGDISAADNGNYYFADQSNVALDVFDAKTLTLTAQIPGDFAGTAGGDHDKSGPAGIVTLPDTSLVYVGDVNAVKVIDVG